MADDGLSIVLNTSSEAPWKSHSRNKFHPEKHEQSFEKNFRRENKTHVKKESESPLPKKSPLKEVVRTSHEHGTRDKEKEKNKNVFVSSIFRNNPDIPKVDKQPVSSVQESVFSGKTFGDLSLHPYMVSNLEEKLGLHQMTAVQVKAIPQILSGNDILIKSQTGSGKTLAYAVPIVQRLQAWHPKIERQHGPYAIVIVPTRELAVQSLETFTKLVRSFVWVVPGAIMGGEKKKAEKSRLRKGINILIGTPGRLIDHLQNTSCLELDRVCYLVVDEADRLLDLGFEKDVSQIISALKERGPSYMQTVLLSATLSSGVEKLAGISLKDPVTVDITSTSHIPTQPHPAHREEKNMTDPQYTPTERLMKSEYSTPEKLVQSFVTVPLKLRLVTLGAFILCKCKYTSKDAKMVIFFATQDSVNFHYKLCKSVLNNMSDDGEDDTEDIEFYCLHGDMLQKDRTKVYQDFCDAESGVLMCTDVAARGLDLPHVNWIVQFNPPASTTDYIHRVGRTARIGSTGQALLFLAPSEVKFIEVLSSLKISMEELKVDDILNSIFVQDKRHNKKISRLSAHSIQQTAIAIQVKYEDFLQTGKEMRTLARKAFQSSVRAYATFPSSMKHIFDKKQLHLGHLAKSFALNEAPGHIGEVVSHTGQKGKRKGPHKESQSSNVPPKKRARKDVSEFSSGLQGVRTVSNLSLNKKTQKMKHKGRKMKHTLKAKK